MNDDVLRAVWLSSRATDENGASRASTIDAVLREERAADQKERRIRVVMAGALILLCPVLLWAAAHGRTPLVRGAYGLMAAGVSVIVFAEWLLLRWLRQGLPGPSDTRSQMRTAALGLARQADLLKMAPVWFAPIFVGAEMISYWIVRERSITGGVTLAVGIGFAWVVAAVACFAKGRAIEARRIRIDQVLSDLSVREADAIADGERLPLRHG